MVPEMGLRVYQDLSGGDVRNLAIHCGSEPMMLP